MKNLFQFIFLFFILVFNIQAQGVFNTGFYQKKANAGCTGTPWGAVAHGYSGTAYSSSAPAGACVSETRTCTNGVMSGTYTNTSCLNGCTGTPWGNVSSGYSNTAWANGSPVGVSCSTVATQTRTCTNGTLSGTYPAASCSSGCATAEFYVSDGRCSVYNSSNGQIDGTCNQIGYCSYRCNAGSWVFVSDGCRQD